MSLEKGNHTYIVEPYHILHYNCMKSDGAVPKIKIGKYCSIAVNCTFILSHHDYTRVSTAPHVLQCYGTIIWVIHLLFVEVISS